LQALPCRSALIDGELVALREDGVSSFSALQAALSAGDTHHLVCFAFDLLHLDGRDLRGEPLLARRAALEDLLARARPSPFLRFSEHFEEPGSVVLDHSCRMGLEGVISKRAGAPYRSGRGQDWIKSKCVQQQEFVIVGYLPSSARGRGFASLILAYRDGDALVGAGNVGTGFDAKSAVALQKRLDAMRVDAAPLSGKAARQKGAVWVRPELVAEVEFRAWTGAGSIRHASFRGLREDKPAAEVVAEIPQDVPPPASGKPRREASGTVPTSGAKVAPPPVTTIRLTSPDKVLWPGVGLTKQHLLDYYALVWPLIREHVVRRPLSLVRAPNGIEGQRFFQKHAMPGMSPAIRRMPDPQDGDDLLWIEDFDGLAALVQLGVVEIHVWGCTIDALEQPDQIVFDLDPDPGVALPAVRAAAAELRGRLSELDMPGMLKLSGGKGYHVVVPLKPQADWAAVKGFAHDFARAMEQSAPDRYTSTLSKKARKGRIFIDYLRNGRGATAIAPWSSRARPGGPVSAPADWSDLPRLAPADITIPRILKGGAPDDAWSGWRRLARPLAYASR
jgi:bifunctional non-homologous end joining protein LigD